MSVPLIPVSIIPRKSLKPDDETVQLSVKWFRELQLEPEIFLFLGRRTFHVKIELIETSEEGLMISEKIFKECQFPIQACKLQACYFPETHTLQLGPVIGLLTDFHINENGEPYFRSIHQFCEELHNGIQECGGFFYVFSHSDFPGKGFYFQNGSWVPSELPLPDVIYNRIHSRRLENSKPVKAFRKNLTMSCIPFFNECFLSKWKVYKQLVPEQHVSACLPETDIFSKESFTQFAQKYEYLFIKPVHGSQGQNIFKLKKEQDLFSCQTTFADAADSDGEKFSLEEIYQQIKQHINHKNYIIQQGIPLLTFEGHSLDFRILCHKNSDYQWKITSVVARIASDQEFVPNLAKGGKVLRPHSVLSACFEKKGSYEILELMKKLSLETADVVSRNSAGLTGELGIDIGVDEQGRLWLIEVNAKPSKNFDDGRHSVRPSAKAIIQFCTALAFAKSSEKEVS